MTAANESTVSEAIEFLELLNRLKGQPADVRRKVVDDGRAAFPDPEGQAFADAIERCLFDGQKGGRA